jgi:hypothetical protein
MPNCWSYGTRTPSCADRLPGCATRPPSGCGWPPCPGCCRPAAGPRSFRSLPPRSWPGTAGWWCARGTTPHAVARDIPPITAAITKLVMRMATENPTGGHRRVQGELVRLGHHIAASTVWQGPLHDAGIDPAPRRFGSSWRQFLITQAKAVLAVDFVPVDTVVLRRIYALIAVEHGSRRAHLVEMSAQSTGEWTTQAAPQPADGPRRPCHLHQVPAPGPGFPVHQGVRRGLRRGQHPDPHQPTPSAAGERPLRKHDRKHCAASCSTGF